MAGCSPRSKVICNGGKRLFPYSPSAKTNRQKRLKEIGTCITVQCIYTIVSQFNFKLGDKVLNEVEYDAKDYAN